MADKPTPETAKVVTVRDLRLGDEIFVSTRFYGSSPELGNRWRRLTGIQEVDGESDARVLFPEVFEGEPRPIIQWVTPDTLVVVRK